MYFNQSGDISTLNGGSLKLVDKLTYFGSSVSTENDIDLHTRPQIVHKGNELVGMSDWTLTFLLNTLESKMPQNHQEIWQIPSPESQSL